MSSINPHYTFKYSQPEEYKFSHDSVFMARRVFEILKGIDIHDWRVLDLCAGCGILGLDFLFHRKQAGLELPAGCDFLDVQDGYLPHFDINARAIPEANVRFLNQNYAELLSGDEKYDLILCNPPFFREGQGHLSPSEFKNRCRFFIDSDFPTLLRAITCSIKPKTGRAYILLRDLSSHGINVKSEALVILDGQLIMRKAGEIRGTSLMSLQQSAVKN